jgi:hypothetical protein
MSGNHHTPKRITVWVQRFKDRPALMLQWIDPDTGKRKTRSAETADEKEAEAKRVDLESDLNNNRYQEASRMTWGRFRELFEAEYLPGVRPGTRRWYHSTLDKLEQLCKPKQVRSVTSRTVSAFVAALRQLPVRGKVGMQASTIQVHLKYLHGVLTWARGQKLLPEMPTFQTVKVPRKKPQPVPAETFERLIEKAEDPQLRAYLMCGQGQGR